MGQRKSSPESEASAQLSEMGYVQRRSVWRVEDVPLRQRPREEMERLGPENVADVALLAIVLRGGVHEANVIDLAADLLHNYKSLTDLSTASRADLMNIKGIGPVKSQVLQAVFELGRRLQEEAAPEKTRIRTPEDAARLLESDVRTLDHEVFWVLHLDAKNRVTAQPDAITRGLLDASLVHPREVFRRAIRHATAAVVLVHNHPSGDPTPSAEDIRITRQLVEAGRIVGISVLDHVIIARSPGNGGRRFASLREDGLVAFE